MAEVSQSRTIKVIVFLVQAFVAALCVLWFVLFAAVMIPVILHSLSDESHHELVEAH